MGFELYAYRKKTDIGFPVFKKMKNPFRANLYMWSTIMAELRKNGLCKNDKERRRKQQYRNTFRILTLNQALSLNEGCRIYPDEVNFLDELLKYSGGDELLDKFIEFIKFAKNGFWVT